MRMPSDTKYVHTEMIPVPVSASVFCFFTFGGVCSNACRGSLHEGMYINESINCHEAHVVLTAVKHRSFGSRFAIVGTPSRSIKKSPGVHTGNSTKVGKEA